MLGNGHTPHSKTEGLKVAELPNELGFVSTDIKCKCSSLPGLFKYLPAYRHLNNSPKLGEESIIVDCFRAAIVNHRHRPLVGVILVISHGALRCELISILL